MKISIEVAELSHQEHTFIYDRPAAQGYYIGEIIGLLENPPHDIEAAVKIQPSRHIKRPFHKALHDAWHTVSGLFTEDLRLHRNLPPSEEIQPLFLHNDLKHLLGAVSFQLILRHKKHTDAVIPFLTNKNAEGIAGFPEELMGNLY